MSKMAAGKSPRDVIAIIEAAYRLDLDDQAWILGVTEAAAPLLDEGRGLAGYLIDTSGARPAAHTPVFTGHDPWQGAWRERWWEARVRRMPVKLIADLAGYGTPIYASESCGAVMQGRVVQRLSRRVPPLPLPAGVSEALVVSGLDPSGAGAVLFAFREQAAPADATRRARWQRISGHLTSAVRLRQHRARDGVEGSRVSAPDVDRARRRQTRATDEALALWPASQDGQVIVPNAHGYLAFESPLVGAPLQRLSPRERKVASLVSLGRSNKAIAYELGVGTSTVSTLLTSAARKLKTRGTAGLIARARPSVQAYPRASELARRHQLSEAETAVLCLLFAGLPDAEIARLRDTTRGTVTKQVDALFRKLGVGSRRELLSLFAPWPVTPNAGKLGR